MTTLCQCIMLDFCFPFRFGLKTTTTISCLKWIWRVFLVERHGALVGALSVWGAFFIFAKYEIRCRCCLINQLQIVSQSTLRNTALDIPNNWKLKNLFILNLEAFGILNNLFLYILSKSWKRESLIFFLLSTSNASWCSFHISLLNLESYVPYR